MKGYLLAVTVASSVALAFAVGCGSSGSGAGGSAGSGGGGTAGSGSASTCSEVTGSGTTQTCAFETFSLGNACAGGFKSGSCPSGGLVGCCVTSVTAGGYTDTSGPCYYDSTTGTPAKAACTGATESWVTTAP